MQTNKKFLAKIKGGDLYETLHGIQFAAPSVKVLKYNLNFKDNLLEWGSKDLKPDAETLRLIKSIHPVTERYYHFRFPVRGYPVRCEFKDGTDSNYCVVVFRNQPPSEEEFKHSATWRYFDAVKKISVSPKVVSNEFALKLKALNGSRDVVVTDNHGKLFKFQEPETWVHDRYSRQGRWEHYPLSANDLTIVENPTVEQIRSAALLSFDHNEWERKEFVPSDTIITIFADSFVKNPTH